MVPRDQPQRPSQEPVFFLESKLRFLKMKAIDSNPTIDRPQVYVLVENRLVRETLIRLFQERSDLCVVGQGRSAEAKDVLNSQCNIVVLDDLNTASLLGLSLLDEFKPPGAMGVVLIDMQDDEEQFLEAVRSGVSGYLLNDASASDVISAVRAVARGEAVCPPRLSLALFRSVAQAALEASPQISQEPMQILTILQQQVIALVAKGLTNKEIASQLNLSALQQRRALLHGRANPVPLRDLGRQQRGLQRRIILLHHGLRQPSPGSGQRTAIRRQELRLRGATHRTRGLARRRHSQQGKHTYTDSTNLPAEAHLFCNPPCPANLSFRASAGH
jgi:DNA-binding NarL/FixJ family response regulator